MTEQNDPATERDDATADATASPPDAPDQNTETVAYSPPPEPHPDWMRSAWLDPAVQPEPTPATVPTEPVAASAPVPRRSGPDGVGRIFAAAVLSAVLASGGTVVVLEGTGALNRPAAAGASGQQPGQSSHPVAIDDSS